MSPAVRAVLVDGGWLPANKNSANKLSQTSTRFSHLSVLPVELRSLHTNLQWRNRALVFKSFQRPRIFENNFELRTADHSLSCHYQTCGRDRLDKALQTIPACLWDLA